MYHAPPVAPVGGYQHLAADAAVPDPDRTRRVVGLLLLVAGCLLGLVLNLAVFVFPATLEPKFDLYMTRLARSALLAYLPVAFYLAIPWLIDRYDPEPWWALAGVFAWGALFATGVSAVINSINGALFGSFFSAAVSAPVFEEATKGLAILGLVIFLRTEFDGAVDGIIYGIFAGIGFAATENIIYYMRFEQELTQIFVLRGVLTPWLHPLFTAMIGLGFGVAREYGGRFAGVLFPLVGYGAGVFLHAWWNGLPALFPAAFILNLIVGVMMALSLVILVAVLVYRKGQTIKKFLHDEVLVGTISQEEFRLITAYGGRIRARLSWRGKKGVAFVAAGARLALSKWHTARAMRDAKHTLSMDFIVPLRQELTRLRNEMLSQPRRK
ncbi:MAG: PrsW family intramembrane metalloprotease [Myxococcota bacterium]